MPRAFRPLLSLLLLLPTSPALASEAAELMLQPVSAEQLREQVRATEAELVLVNVWATWCKPCREEMPDLLRLAANYRPQGLELILVSTDFERNADQARDSLAAWGVEGSSFIKAQRDEPFINGLSPAWGGALPASFLFSPQGELLSWWQGVRSYEEMARLVESRLAP